MTISISELRAFAQNPNMRKGANLMDSARGMLKSVFLCHSHLDAELVQGVLKLFHQAGWNDYVDWNDKTMPAQPDQVTASRLKEKIASHNYFVFLATANSIASRWCPWEIGYADGAKANDSILILPTSEGTQTHGSEYLGLYRCIDWNTVKELRVWQAGQTQNGVLLRGL